MKTGFNCPKGQCSREAFALFLVVVETLLRYCSKRLQVPLKIAFIENCRQGFRLFVTYRLNDYFFHKRFNWKLGIILTGAQAG